MLPSREEVKKMFYVRERISKTAELSVELHDDNVFCACPGCGREVCVNLAELFCDGEGDLYGTSVYCAKCSRARLEGIR
jgi:3-dehydroquinate synthase class II